MSIPSPAPVVGRFTGIVLGLVVFVCVTMIGGTGYLKYQLDTAETVLAAPDNALGSDQDMFDRLRRDLGYGGFLGLAQNYVQTHDASGFAEMKAHVKSANDIIAHLPDKTPAEMRHELTAIAAVFNSSLQKISAAPGEPISDFTAPDLAPLYAAMPILDARVSSAKAETRLAAQNKMQFWSMLLTVVSWVSLIIAAACAAGIYLTLRDKHSAPMRALAQSIQNMARGDMRTAIWGIERQDMIGELARSVDIARYHFSHLPDLSLISEQGPVRMRFEGGTRSLFEAMMKALSEDSTNIRTQSLALTDAVQQQKSSITAISEKVETVLNNILQNGQNGDLQIRQAIHDMLGSAEGLKNAHAHAADQLNRLIPHIQDRAQGMSEIAQITGKQIGQTLQSMASNELSLKVNAEQAKETLLKLSSTADALGERLFGAINLLQASGKVLAETTDEIRGRMGENAVFSAPEIDLSPLVTQLDDIAHQLAFVQSSIDNQPQAQAPSDHAPYTSMDPVANAVQLSDIANLLATQIEPKLASLSEKIITAAENLPANIKARLHDEYENLATHLDASLDHLSAKMSSNIQAPAMPNGNGDLTRHMDAIAVSLGTKIDSVSASIPYGFQKTMQNDLAILSSQFTTMRSDVTNSVIDQVKRVLGQQHTETFAGLQSNLSAMADKIAALQEGLAKTVEMPSDVSSKMNDLWRQLAGQIEASRASLDATLQQEVMVKLGALEATVGSAQQAIEDTRAEVSKPAAVSTLSIPPELQKQMLDQWFQMSAQLESTRAALLDAITDQVEKLETKMAAKGSEALSKTASEYSTQRQIEQQTQILSEMVATMGVLDAHMQQLKTEVHASARN